MNNPFDYTPDDACAEAFRRLTAQLEALKNSSDPADVIFLRELEAGKMLGVMIASDADGAQHTLYAFSGQLGDRGFHHPGFTAPVFDYLQPDGYFKSREQEISALNADITRFENEILAEIRADYARGEEKLRAEVAAFKERCRQSKCERDAKRASGQADEEEMAAMIRQSQFEKAELHRLKKRGAVAIEPLAARLREAQAALDAMKYKRRAESEALQKWLFSNFRLLNARGESRSLSEIFADTPLQTPPSGAGECCAPKLLQAAYLRGLKPEAMAEYWYGRPKGGELRIHGRHYPACRGKCLPVLGWMLQGLRVEPPLDNGTRRPVLGHPEIIYENEWFCVVVKPSGMLSVPGKGDAISVERWLAERYGEAKSIRMAHRLDQDTSGLLIASFGVESYRIMQSLFARRRVKKTYIAVLEGDYAARGVARRGRISLPLLPDWLDRPRQRVDVEAGKEAVTYYEFTDVSDGRSRITFWPQTGRTHQLRVHAAAETGLAMPIVGDPLYGRRAAGISERLHLHARMIEFTFPLDGKRYCFESPAPF